MSTVFHLILWTLVGTLVFFSIRHWVLSPKIIYRKYNNIEYRVKLTNREGTYKRVRFYTPRFEPKWYQSKYVNECGKYWIIEIPNSLNELEKTLRYQWSSYDKEVEDLRDTRRQHSTYEKLV